MADITERKASIDRQNGDVLAFPMGAEQIFEGAIVAVNSAGYLVNAGDDAGAVVVGVADESKDNSGGSAGDLKLNVVRNGVITVNAAHTAAQTDVGVIAMASDNQTINLAANTTNDVPVGRIVEFISSSKVRVDLGDKVA